MNTGKTNQTICCICREDLGNPIYAVDVHQKGGDGINSCNLQRGDVLVVTVGEKVHLKCRQRYTNQKTLQIKKEGKEMSHPKEVSEFQVLHKTVIMHAFSVGL